MTVAELTAPQLDNSAPLDLGGDDAAMSAIWDKAQTDGVTEETGEAPLRDAAGKYTKPEQPEGDKAPLEGEDGAVGQEQATVPATAAPAHLPQAVKAAWEAIPEDARKAIVDQQAATDRRFSELGRQMEQSRPIVDRLTQASSQFPQFAGMSPDQLAQGAVELAAVQASLEGGDLSGRVNTILQIAQHYGVLPHLAAQIAGGNIDTAALQRPLMQPQQARQTQPQDIEAQISRALEMRDTEASIDAFAKAKPFFAEVEADMSFFVTQVRERQPQASLNDVLETAYDMAINANPTTRQKVRELEAKATAPQIDTKRAEDAKKAASINVKPTINGKERQPSEDEAMAAAYDRMMAS